MNILKIMFKKISLWLILANLLVSCNTEINATKNKEKSLNCGLDANYKALVDVKSRQDFFRLFDFYIQAIIKQDDRLIFQTKNHDLVFCQANQSFTIQSGTWQKPTEKNYQQLTEELSNPPYKTITLNEQNYQYRVLLKPNPFPNFQEVEAKEVIFELILPDNSEPIRQVVYDLDQVIKAQSGISLGVPEIVTAKIFNNQIFWAISPQKGEGNGGIATIINYAPNNNKLNIIQPPEITYQQINDLVITEENNQLTFWLATKIAGEGNPYLPSMGLVIYQPDKNNEPIKSYNVRNSPIIGAIPTKLGLDDEFIWIGTGNGICRILRQKIDNDDSWQCWQIKLLADINIENIDIYPSLLSQEKIDQIEGNKVEVLWWAGNQENGDEGRYEINYKSGINLKLPQGATSWQIIDESSSSPASWQAPVYWLGKDWYWRNGKFQRGFDSVPLNFVGGGPTGFIIPSENYTYPRNLAAIRGDLDLINISDSTTEIKYYSGWVDSNLLTPYLNLIPAPKFVESLENPLANINQKNTSQP